MSHYIIGTAGHIDHGKTTLTKALTGVDTDRLKEEKERNISIELGFAPFTLPNGQRVSLIDVPGHERFIRQMVSGVGGIDFVLLVIAADEGIMPQTKEHLQILQHLGIHSGLVVLTKIDLVDQEWLELVEEEVRDYVKNTFLAHSPIIPVSSKTGAGMERLYEHIEMGLANIPSRPVSGPFRMPIDRVFHLKGAGAVVTGTIYSGTVHQGDQVELLPSGRAARVRQVHVHGEECESAVAGQRAALNVAGVDLDEIHRGDVIATPLAWVPSIRIDCEIHFQKDNEFTLKQRSVVKLLIGTKEILTTLILYDRKEVRSGDTVFAQLQLHEPTVMNREDRFIIRRPTPPLTIGGGWVIDPHADKHKINRQTSDAIAEKAKASLDEQVHSEISTASTLLSTPLSIAEKLKIDLENVIPEIQKLVDEQKIVRLHTPAVDYYMDRLRELEILEQVTAFIQDFHEKFPTRKGVNKAEVTKRFLSKVTPKLLNTLWEYWRLQAHIMTVKEDLSLPGFSPHVPDKWIKYADALLEAVKTDGLTPKKWSEYCEALHVAEHISSELLTFFMEENKLIGLGDDIYIHLSPFLDAKKKLTEYLAVNMSITVAEAKELFGLSRKYLILLLECFDSERITLRQNDVRILHGLENKKSS